MRQLVEYLISIMEEHVKLTGPIHNTTVALQAAREALKSLPEPVQALVKIVEYNCTCGRTMQFESVNGVVAPQRQWVGLKVEEIEAIGKPYEEKDRSMQAWGLFACAIENKLKEKNT